MFRGCRWRRRHHRTINLLDDDGEHVIRFVHSLTGKLSIRLVLAKGSQPETRGRWREEGKQQSFPLGFSSFALSVCVSIPTPAREVWPPPENTWYLLDEGKDKVT